MRTAFLGPVTVDVDRGPQCFIQNIDFRGAGSGTALTVEADGQVQNCLFTGWDTGLLVGGDDWADPMGCWFEGNGVNLSNPAGHPTDLSYATFT